MAKSTVPVNFKDDIMNSAMNGKRRYRMINNSDGTISLEDVTTYDQVGSNFGAAQMNATNQAVNAAADASKIIDDIDAIRALTQEGYMAGALALKQVDDSLVNENNESFNFGVKDGVRGFFTNPSRADDCFVPFKSGNIIDITDLLTHETISGFKYSVYDVSGIQGYQNLTVDNFVFSISKLALWAVTADGSKSAYPTYDSNTGIFKMAFHWSNNDDLSCTVTINKAYLIF